jgi:hypothetical protein
LSTSFGFVRVANLHHYTIGGIYLSLHIVTVQEIKAIFDEKLGRDTGRGYIYMSLKRHKWHKVMPRPRHPKKADDKAVDASKN